MTFQVPLPRPMDGSCHNLYCVSMVGIPDRYLDNAINTLRRSTFDCFKVICEMNGGRAEVTEKQLSFFFCNVIAILLFFYVSELRAESVKKRDVRCFCFPHRVCCNGKYNYSRWHPMSVFDVHVLPCHSYLSAGTNR